MDPPQKKRKLAPKAQNASGAASSSATSVAAAAPTTPSPSIIDPSQPKNDDFERYARHLQDAAMLIQKVAEPPAYTSVSVLFMYWEGDDQAATEVDELETVFLENLNYNTERFSIPAAVNASTKMGARVTSFLHGSSDRDDASSSHHLNIIYYAGHGFPAADGSVYWAKGPQKDSYKLKWDGVRRLIEESPSDILLLLDTCSAPLEATVQPQNPDYVKLVIAAHSTQSTFHDAAGSDASTSSSPPPFTRVLVDCLRKYLAFDSPFAVHALYEDVLTQRHEELTQLAPQNEVPAGNLPVMYTITPGKYRHIILPSNLENISIEDAEAKRKLENPFLQLATTAVQPESVLSLTFDQPRVLVCTTFVGEANSDMSFFRSWLEERPHIAPNITVEAMFFGPPTMLLISMDLTVWEIVRHDKVCIFLGYIGSHNFVHLYKNIKGVLAPETENLATGTAAASNAAAPLAASLSSMTGLLGAGAASTHGTMAPSAATNANPLTAINGLGVNSHIDPQDMIVRTGKRTADQLKNDALTAALARNLGKGDAASAFASTLAEGGGAEGSGKTGTGQDSAEIQAAEQLKALGQVPSATSTSSSTGANANMANSTAAAAVANALAEAQANRRSTLPDHAPDKLGLPSHFDLDLQESLSGLAPATTAHAYNPLSTGSPSLTNVRAKAPRRSVSTKQSSGSGDNVCSFCSHAPFKDSSTLRKHIAAAHTRPFPCTFAFAGCTSTFGSKNEWKRHIASQHLCLQYYRCSVCPLPNGSDGKFNEFNRKDLFTQHLRRMHAPLAIKKSVVKPDSKLYLDWEAQVKELHQSCLVQRRLPPQRCACPKNGCQSVFEGVGAWDEWTEHVGRHLEKGETSANMMNVDENLALWSIEEGIVEREPGTGEFRLIADNSSSNKQHGHQNHHTAHHNQNHHHHLQHLQQQQQHRQQQQQQQQQQHHPLHHTPEAQHHHGHIPSPVLDDPLQSQHLQHQSQQVLDAQQALTPTLHGETPTLHGDSGNGTMGGVVDDSTGMGVIDPQQQQQQQQQQHHHHPHHPHPHHPHSQQPSSLEGDLDDSQERNSLEITAAVAAAAASAKAEEDVMPAVDPAITQASMDVD